MTTEMRLRGPEPALDQADVDGTLTGADRGRWKRFAFILGSGLIALVITALVLIPVVSALGESFSGGAAGYRAAATSPWFRKMLLHTLIVVVFGGGSALVIGTCLAWVNERTDGGLRWASRLVPVLPLMLLPVAGTIGWVTLLAPSAGYLNYWLTRTAHNIGFQGFTSPLNIFSWYGMCALYAMYLAPHTYLIVGAALRDLDARVEEAASTSGAGPLTVFRRITLPAIRPAVVSAGLLMLVESISMFSVPSILAGQSNADILSVRIVRLLTFAYPPETGTAAALGTMLMPLFISVWLYQRYVSRSERRSVTGGKGQTDTRVGLGGLRRPVRLFILAYCIAAGALPLMALGLASVQQFWNPDIVVSLLNLENYRQVFSEPSTKMALQHSVVLAVVGATILMAVSALVASTAASRLPGRGLSVAADGMQKLPGAVSHVVAAIGILLAFGGAPFHLQGTMAILLVAYVVQNMPQASLAATSAMSRVGSELDSAAAVSGAGPFRRMSSITLPLMLPGLAAGWVIVFVFMVGDLTASKILASTQSVVVGFKILELYENGTIPQLAALAIVICAITSTMTLLVLFASGRQFRVRSRIDAWRRS